MKHCIALFLLLFSSASYAQSLDLFTGLHPRPQVSYFLQSNRPTTINKTWSIAYDCQPGVGTLRAIAYLQRRLQSLLGDSLQLIPYYCDSEPTVLPDSNLIVIGKKSDGVVFPYLQKLPITDSLSQPEGYAMNIDANQILIAGADTNGTFNAVSTLVQLIAGSGNKMPSMHIYDWPDYPIRWVFSLHNLIEQSQVAALETIEDTMAAHKLNGLQQNDFKNNIYSVFEGSYPQYFYNVDTLQAYSAKTNVEIIPGVFPFGWSEGILFHDPDIAEGIPTTSSLFIQGDTGVVLTDPNMILPNGGFENVSNGQFTGWSFYDGPKVSAFVDSTTVHSGKYSARCTNFVAGNAGGNCRFERSVLCKPFHGYHMSVWINSQNFSGEEVQLLAIGHNGAQSTSLTYTAFSVPSTSNGWSQYNVVFNTLTYDSLYVYCGVWGGSAGTIWFDDFQIEDAGLTNVLRPSSELPLVSEAGRSTTYVEGKDYAAVVDSILEKNEGSYPWHSSPSFTILPGSAIKNGDTVQVHFIRPNPVENDATGDGSTMVCVSEDTLYPILQNQLSLVDAQYHAGKYFMSHDEIREMNWDTACTSRKLSPAALLADNVKKSDSIIQKVHPGAERFDWSDMFDSLHNAHNNYYLVNGDLTGDWNLIPKDLTIVNWNGGFMSQSLDFFSKLGFSQITSPYYDVQNTVNMRDWRLAMDTIPNMRGMMYTTWANDYSFLTPFADYAWSAGPMIVFQPIDSVICYPNPIVVNADIFPDPYLSTDSIKAAFAVFNVGKAKDTLPLLQTAPNHYTGSFTQYLFAQTSSKIVAVNVEGLYRETPFYQIPVAICDDVSLPISNQSVQLFPNPALNTISVHGISDEPTTILIEDMLGREVASAEVTSVSSVLDIQNIPAGIYECIVTGASGARAALPFVKE